MNEKKYFNIKIIVLSIIILCYFSGCSEKEENSSLENGTITVNKSSSTNESVTDVLQTGEQTLFRINELSWPDPDQCIMPFLTDGIKMQPGELQMENGYVWREIWLYDEEFQAAGTYFEKLESPYKEWKVVEVDDHYSESGKEYFIGTHFSYDGKWAFCVLRDLETNQLFWGKCDKEKVTELLGEFPEECKNSEIRIMNEDTIYAFQKGGKTMYRLNAHMEIEKEYTFLENILDIVEGDSDGDVYWYGYSSEAFGMFDLSDHPVLPENNEIGAGWGKVVKGKDQTYYILWGGKLFCLVQNHLQCVLDFGTRDYPWEEIETIHMNSDGSIQILGHLDGEECFVQLEKTENIPSVEKQEIVLACMFRHNALLKSIGRFNRRNDKYHICVVVKDDNEEWGDYERRLQLDMSSGQGADLFLDDALTDVAGYARNGYLQKMDDILQDKQDIFEPVLEGGKIDGDYYGIPYDFEMQFASYSASFAGSRDSFTIEELMKATEASDADILQYAFDGTDIVMWYGLYDNDNVTYIDWENGISHLEEEPFKELLTFAQKYKDPQAEKHQNRMELQEGEYLMEGKSLATESVMTDVTTLNALDACFEGNAKMLGYPATQGNGIYTRARYLYVKNASEYKEGIREFLDFLLSEEEQTKYAKYQPTSEEVMGYQAYFPVQKEAFASLLEYEKNNTLRKNIKFLSDNRGLKYDGTTLTEEGAEKIRWMVEQAKPSNWKALDIQGMVEEELTPYFEGQRDLDETTKRLHNRVQLYLDERK